MTYAEAERILLRRAFVRMVLLTSLGLVGLVTHCNSLQTSTDRMQTQR